MDTTARAKSDIFENLTAQMSSQSRDRRHHRQSSFAVKLPKKRFHCLLSMSIAGGAVETLARIRSNFGTTSSGEGAAKGHQRGGLDPRFPPENSISCGVRHSGWGVGFGDCSAFSNMPLWRLQSYPRESHDCFLGKMWNNTRHASKCPDVLNIGKCPRCGAN